jgi:(E)-4-hydroxy-3-methylbut-2-enyl-diphosphate synthase
MTPKVRAGAKRITTASGRVDVEPDKRREEAASCIVAHRDRDPIRRIPRVRGVGTIRSAGMLVRLHKTVGVKVGGLQVGGGAPVVVQSMTMTDTADARATADQCIELATAGSEMVRVTVNLPEAAAAVPDQQRMLDAGCGVLSSAISTTTGTSCSRSFRNVPARSINTASIPETSSGAAPRRAIRDDLQSRWGQPQAGAHRRQWRLLNRSSSSRRCGEHRPTWTNLEEIINDCMVVSAIESTALAVESGLRKDRDHHFVQDVAARDLIAVYRERHAAPINRCTWLDRSRHGREGLVWSSAAMGVLLNEGIGDTVRVSLTPRPGGDRREEVYAACELLQALGLRSFSPSVTACPAAAARRAAPFRNWPNGSRTTSAKMPDWKTA